MKKVLKYLLFTVIFLFQIYVSNAQNRILSLENGISLIGISKNQMNLDVNQLEYTFDNSSDNIVAYSKIINDEQYLLTVIYANSIVNAISWTENGDFLPMYNNDIAANLGFVKYKEFDTGEAHVFSYRNFNKNLTVSFTWRYIDDKSHFVVTIGKIRNNTKAHYDPTSNGQNLSVGNKINKRVNINWSKLKNRKFLVGYIVIASAYEKLVEKSHAYNVDFFDPYSSPIDTLTSIDNRKVGLITITDAKTNKIFKKYYIIFDKMVINKYTSSFLYKIQNADGSKDVITLDLSKWNRVVKITKVPFSFSITIETLSSDNKKSNEMNLWCNVIK